MIHVFIASLRNNQLYFLKILMQPSLAAKRRHIRKQLTRDLTEWHSAAFLMRWTALHQPKHESFLWRPIIWLDWTRHWFDLVELISKNLLDIAQDISWSRCTEGFTMDRKLKRLQHSLQTTLRCSPSRWVRHKFKDISWLIRHQSRWQSLEKSRKFGEIDVLLRYLKIVDVLDCVNVDNKITILSHVTWVLWLLFTVVQNTSFFYYIIAEIAWKSYNRVLFSDFFVI